MFMLQKRGVGLGSTLLVTAIVAILGFALAAASVTHINLMSRADNSSAALALARNAIATTLGHLCTDKAFKQTITVTGPDGSKAQLTFDDPSLGIPLSLNNLTGPASTLAADGQVVPLQGAYLVARAKVRGVTRQVRALYNLPPFPYAAASDGPILSPGNLVVGALKEGQDPNEPPANLLPADLLTNDTGASALTLGPSTSIRGDLRSGGGVSLDPGTRVAGRVLTDQDRLAVPEMKAASYDPVTLGQPYADLDESYPETTFTGTLRRDGNVTVTGPLKLDRALVFVTGNLNLQGGVKGSGILVTLGNLTVTGQADIEPDSRVALLCGGKLDLQGSGPASSNIKGLVYAEGGVSAKQLKLRGALVARNAPPVMLDSSRLLNDGVALQPGYGVLPAGPPRQQTGFIVGERLRIDPPSHPAGAPGKTYSYIKANVTLFWDGMIDITAQQFNFKWDDVLGEWVPDTPAVVDLPSTGKVPFTGGTSHLGTYGWKPPVPPDVDEWRIDEPGGGSGAASGTYTLKLDPAELMPTKDRIRALMWLEGAPQ